MGNGEDPLIKQYHKKVGGTLVREFRMVKKTERAGRRALDALILPGVRVGDRQWYRWPDVPDNLRNGKALNGRSVILVQAKNARLGMSVMGQALFSRLLMEEWCRSKRVRPKSMTSWIVCTAGDRALEPFLKRFGLKLSTTKERLRRGQ